MGAGHQKKYTGVGGLTHSKEKRRGLRQEVGRDRHTCTRGSDASSTLSLLVLCCSSLGVNVLAVEGVVVEVRTGQNTAKKDPLTQRGTAREDDALYGVTMGTGAAVMVVMFRL